MRAIFYIETEKLDETEWHARLHLEALGEVGIANGYAPTQIEAVRKAIQFACDRFGKEIVLPSGDDKLDWKEWEEMLLATQALYGK